MKRLGLRSGAPVASELARGVVVVDLDLAADGALAALAAVTAALRSAFSLATV